MAGAYSGGKVTSINTLYTFHDIIIVFELCLNSMALPCFLCEIESVFFTVRAQAPFLKAERPYIIFFVIYVVFVIYGLFFSRKYCAFWHFLLTLLTLFA